MTVDEIQIEAIHLFVRHTHTYTQNVQGKVVPILGNRALPLLHTQCKQYPCGKRKLRLCFMYCNESWEALGRTLWCNTPSLRVQVQERYSLGEILVRVWPLTFSPARGARDSKSKEAGNGALKAYGTGSVLLSSVIATGVSLSRVHTQAQRAFKLLDTVCISFPLQSCTARSIVAKPPISDLSFVFFSHTCDKPACSRCFCSHKGSFHLSLPRLSP